MTTTPVASVSAHHSFAPYDAKQVMTLSGTVGVFRWSNPHVTFTVVVSAEKGAPQEWNVITSSPAILQKFGWTHDSVRTGDRVSLDCEPMADGSHGGRLRTLTQLDSGRVLRTKLSAARPDAEP